MTTTTEVSLGQTGNGPQKGTQTGRPPNPRSEILGNVTARLKTVREQMETAEKDLASATPQIKTSRAAMNSAAAELGRLKSKLEEASAQRSGNLAARKKAQEIRDRYEEASAPYLAKAKETEEYRLALAKAEQASKEIRDISRHNELPRDVLLEESAKAASLMTAVRELEQRALDRVPELRTIKSELREAEKDVQETAKAMREMIENDPESRRLHVEHKQAKTDYEQSMARVQAAQSVLQTGRRELEELEFLQKGMSRSSRGRGRR